MSTKSLIAKSAALAALTLTVVGGTGLAASPAEAGFKKHHHHGFRVVIGAPLVYGGYGYGYRAYHGGRPCAWMYRRAVNTGSSYWWKRFHQCRYGY
jgi:hypothetical protein